MDIETELYKILPDQTQLSPTEKRNPSSMNLTKSNINQIIGLFIDDSLQAVQCLNQCSNEIETLIEDVISCLKNKGRLFYVAAGSSAKIALLDALECPLTFGCESDTIQTIVAGNESFNEEHGIAEDYILDGYRIVEKLVNKNDFVLGISASGFTQFVWSALYAANKNNARTGLLTFNKFIKPKIKIDNLIKVNSGPEILTGSTRLKCGNLTKIVLNMVSTISMIKLGYCVSNLMICVRPTNIKLKQRLVNILMALLENNRQDINEDKAVELLKENSYDIKKVLSILNLDYQI